MWHIFPSPSYSPMFPCNLVCTGNGNLTELLTVVIPQWANNIKISDNVRNIKKGCSLTCIVTSKITDSTVQYHYTRNFSVSFNFLMVAFCYTFLWKYTSCVNNSYNDLQDCENKLYVKRVCSVYFLIDFNCWESIWFSKLFKVGVLNIFQSAGATNPKFDRFIKWVWDFSLVLV